MFLFSLVNYDIYIWSIGLLFILLFLIVERIKIRKKALAESFILFVLLSIAALRFQLFLIEDVLPLYINAFWGNYWGLALCILTWLFIRSIALSNKKMLLVDTVAPLLWVHLSSFFIQFIIFLSSGKYLDFVEPITGEPSRYKSFLGSSNIVIGSIRPTGLLVEPSTYFYVVLALASLLIIFKGFKRNKVLLIFTIVSMYLSFSTAAVIIASLFILFLFFSSKFRKRYIIWIVIVSIALLVFGGGVLIVTVYTSQQEKFDQTSGIRLNLLTAVLNRDIHTSILAFGPFAVDKHITNASARIGVRDNTVASLNDSGILVFMWVEFGYFGIAIFLLMCYWQYRFGKRRFILFLIFSLSKANPFLPFFVMYFAVSILTISPARKSKLSTIKKGGLLLFDEEVGFG